MRLIRYLGKVLTVQRCLGCGEILNAECIGRVFCNSCRTVWNRALMDECPHCHAEAYKCMCMPKLLSRAGALCCRKLMLYRSDDVYSAEFSLLYHNKRIPIKRLVNFLAENMLPQIKEELQVLGAENSALITFVPRSRRSYAKYGFDQSELLARTIAKMMGLECACVFGTRLLAKQQKQLGASKRLENAKSNIYVRCAEGISGRYVILIDDMVTSGAGMSVCVEHLRSHGSRGVLCFCAASKNKM